MIDIKTAMRIAVAQYVALSYATDEIERLRGLITAWADADERYFTTVHTYDSEYMSLLREERDDALDALRKAVGR